MIDPRLLFLLLTAAMLATLIGIGIYTYRKGSRKKMEEPKYRMLDDD